MNKRRSKAAKRDGRTTPEIVDAFSRAPEAEKETHSLGVLHARGSQLEFEAGKTLCRGKSAEQRVLGTDILAQLGWEDRTFLDETVDILIPMLADLDPEVAGAAGIALGHRNSSRAIAPALLLRCHSNEDVRFGAVSALSNHDDLEAVGGLIKLSMDKDRDVRNWATFGLGQLTDLDTAELRDALFERTSDGDAEIRGEAFIGLALRQDRRFLAPLEKELSGEFHGGWCIEAASLLKETRLHSLLVKMKSRLTPDDLRAFGDQLDQAIAACLPN